MQQVILTNVQLNFFDQYVNSLKNQGFNQTCVVNSSESRTFIRMKRVNLELNYCKNCLNAVHSSLLDEHSCTKAIVHEI
jgi:hypothetical protein